MEKKRDSFSVFEKKMINVSPKTKKSFKTEKIAQIFNLF